MKQFIVYLILLVGLVACTESGLETQLKEAYAELPSPSKATFDHLQEYFQKVDADQGRFGLTPLTPFRSSHVAEMIKNYLEGEEFLPKDGRNLEKEEEEYRELVKEELEHFEVISDIYQSKLGSNIDVTEDNETWSKLDVGTQSAVLAARFVKLVTDEEDDLESILDRKIFNPY